MIEINLLPKDYRKGSGALSLGKTGFYAVGVAAGLILILVAITFYQMHQLSTLKTNIDKANQRATMLRSDIRVVDALIDVKDKIHRRIEAVEQLDRYRSTWVRILEDVAKNVPEFVWVSKFEEIPPEPKPEDTASANVNPESVDRPSRPVEIKGYSFTLNALAAFMIKTMRSDYFDSVELVSSEDKEVMGEKAYEFVLSCNVHYLSEEDLRNLIAQAGQGSDTKATHKSLN